MRALANHQQQAEQDLQRLAESCGNTIDRMDRRIRLIEAAYNKLAQGTQYVYEQIEKKEHIVEEWVRNELMVATNAYQNFIRQVLEAIIERTNGVEAQHLHEATQVT